MVIEFRLLPNNNHANMHRLQPVLLLLKCMSEGKKRFKGVGWLEFKVCYRDLYNYFNLKIVRKVLNGQFGK